MSWDMYPDAAIQHMLDYPPGKNCSTGCKTKDHMTYGACIRAKNTGAQGMSSAPSVFSKNTPKESK